MRFFSRSAPSPSAIRVNADETDRFAKVFEKHGAAIVAGALPADWVRAMFADMKALAERFDSDLAQDPGLAETDPAHRLFAARSVVKFSLANRANLPFFGRAHDIYAKLSESGLLDAVEDYFGEKIFFLLDANNLRIQRPEADIEMSKLNFHQEGAALAFPSAAYRGVVVWVPLNEIDDDMASLEFVGRRFDRLLPHVGNPVSKMTELDNLERFQADNRNYIYNARGLACGDVVVLSAYTPHRTEVPATLNRMRASLDFRACPMSSIPPDYNGSLLRP